MIRVFLLLLSMSLIFSEQPISISEKQQVYKSQVKTTTHHKTLQSKLDFNIPDTRPEKVYIQLDKTMYQLGETIWFNVFIRDALSHKISTVSEFVYVQLYEPNGNIIKNLKLPVRNGQTKGDIMLDPNSLGGKYQLRAFTESQAELVKKEDSFGFQKEIIVQKNILPKLRMTLEFERKTYGAGALVQTNLELKTLNDQPLRYHPFEYQISLDGKKVGTIKDKTDFEGKAILKYQLPQNLTTNDGLLNVLIDYNGLTESISRAIPIVLNDIDVQFLPESGILIANAENVIAFKAIDEFGKPADISGILYNEKQQELKSFISYHQGMGKFKFLPEYGQNYTVKITSPKGIDKIYQLPKVEKARQNGIQVISQNQEHLTIKIIGKSNRNLTLTALANNFLYETLQIKKSRKSRLKIPIKNIPMGILTLRLTNSKNRPIAERLVFVHPQKRLKVDIQTNKKQYQPREKVKMKIVVKDDSGHPIKGHFGLSVIDDKLLTFANDKQANIMAYMLLQSELRGKIVEPNFYFEAPEKYPNKDQTLALDLLMMTQGWRKYDWMTIMQPITGRTLAIKKRQISGTILDDNNKPLKKARVYIPNTKLETRTNNEGQFKFENIWINKGLAVHIEHLESENIITYYDYIHQNITYLNQRDLSFSIVERLKNNTSKAQISGIAIEEITGEELIGASIYLKELNIGNITNQEAQFNINNIEPGTYQLIASYLGFRRIETTITLAAGDHLKIRLTFEEGLHLDETVVVESSKRKKQPRSKKIKRKKKTPSTKPIATPKNNPLFEPPIIKRNQKIIATKAIKNVPAIVSHSPKTASLDNETTFLMESNDLDTIIPNDAPIDDMNLDWNDEDFPSMEQLFFHFKNKINQGDHLSKFVLIDSVIVPRSIIIEALRHINLSNLVDFKSLDPETIKRRIGSRHQNSTVFEIITKEEKTGKSKRYKRDLKRIARNSIKVYNKDVKHYNVLVRKYSRVAKGIELPTTNLTEQFENIKKNRSKIGKAFRKNRERYQFLGMEMPKILKLERLYSPTYYNYALNFKEGLYQAREFYIPKYETPEAENVNVRTDFRSTIYWNSNLILDEKGQAEVEFYTNDDITTFRAIVEGISQNGQVGRNEMTFYNQMPLSMYSKMPLTAIKGDLIKIPLTFINNTDTILDGKLTINIPKNLILQGKLPAIIRLKAKEKRTIFITCRVTYANIIGRFLVEFQASDWKDAFEKTLKTLDPKFDITEVFLPPKDATQPMKINLNQLDSSIQAQITLYPAPLSEIIETAKRMIRQPAGCFEQTSSVNYPNILAYQYLESTGNLSDENKNKIKRLLKKSLDILISYEVKGGGFNWYKKGAAHEGLTAHGLMQFVEMSKIIDVSPDLIKRTSAWLMSRRDGKGGFTFSKEHYRWGEKQEISTAYIVWAISRAGFGKKVEKEINHLYQSQSKDPYVLSLLANTLEILEDNRSQKVIHELLALQEKNGSWIGKKMSMTNSTGNNLRIETTALAALAIMKNSINKQIPLPPAVHQAISFIQGAKSKYGYRSTQSTVLALQALKEYALLTIKYTATNGKYTLMINGQEIEKGRYLGKNANPITLTGFEQYLKSGNNDIQVLFSEGKGLNYDLYITRMMNIPPSKKCAVGLTTALLKKKIKLGETVRLTTMIENKTPKDIPNTLAIVGIPSGLSLQSWQLKSLQEKGAFDYYEIMDGYIVFHFLNLEANVEKAIHLDLKADVLGQFTAPSSSAYLYYNNDWKHWENGVTINIFE